MAHDLIYGKTSRDWRIGALLDMPSRQQLASDIRASVDVGPLAKVVEMETQAAFHFAAKLTNEKKLPAIERKAFKPTLQKWFALRDKRQGNFQGEDYVELVNLRDATRAYRKRLEAFEKGQTPVVPPTAPESHLVRNGLLIGLGATAVILATKK